MSPTATASLRRTTDAATPRPIRRLPLPDCEPPYDDEIGTFGHDATGWGRSSPLSSAASPSAGVQGTLALSFTLPSGVPAVPQPSPDLRLVGGGPGGGAADAAGTSAAEEEDADDADDFGPRPTGRASLPEPRSWAGRVVQAIVEVLAGVRPASQLVRWTTAEVYDEISSRVVSSHGATEPVPPRGVVSSVHVTEPADGVAEVCALVRRGARSTAVAIRLEGMDGRWQCTALELG
ncbi:MAG: Rv3235 family protein [Actinomycetes bacterium]